MPGTLLIVDDAPVIRYMITETVTKAGWQVQGEAGDGQEAINRYAELQPDVVTLDMVMPNFDGLHALSGIRELDRNAAVVVVSALNQAARLKEAFKRGAADFLVKPFDPEILLNTLESALEQRRAGAGV